MTLTMMTVQLLLAERTKHVDEHKFTRERYRTELINYTQRPNHPQVLLSQHILRFCALLAVASTDTRVSRTYSIINKTTGFKAAACDETRYRTLKSNFI